VYGWDTLVLLKHYLESGLSKTAVARQLGVSRRVIYHWITTAGRPRVCNFNRRKCAIQIGVDRSRSTPR
jgi:transposase-like protein